MPHIESWRPFPLNEVSDLFEISDFGRVRNVTDNELIPWHYSIRVSGPKRFIRISGPEIRLFPRLTFNVPRSVLLAFCGPPLPGQLALHRNDRRLDNRYPENLYWGTAADNGEDRSRNILFRKYECVLPEKLTPLLPFTWS